MSPSGRLPSHVFLINSQLGFERTEIQTFICTDNHHRKLAIIDRKIVWEGSLNIPSQSNSREIMRRIEGKEIAEDAFNFLRFDRFI